MKSLCTHLYHRVVLTWDLERSHALISLGYGLYLWCAQTLHGPSLGYRLMGRVAQALAPDVDAEAVWGSLLVLTGLLTLAGLIGGSPKTRRGGALLRSAIWALMACCFALGNPLSPGGFLWAALSFSALMCGLQVQTR